MKKINGLFDLNGKTAIVTGASYGLGVTFAECLAQFFGLSFEATLSGL